MKKFLHSFLLFKLLFFAGMGNQFFYFLNIIFGLYGIYFDKGKKIKLTTHNYMYPRVFIIDFLCITARHDISGFI